MKAIALMGRQIEGGFKNGVLRCASRLSSRISL